jgi:predicted RNA binding protein YcfA (HicA-like mRNA interferase family)
MAKMPKLPIISGKDAVKVFKKDSWVINRQAGDHIIISMAKIISEMEE